MPMATKGKHLIIATGGTGGHFYPALAIALEHERQGGVVTLLVAGHNTARHLETARKAGLAAFACSAPRRGGGAPSPCSSCGPASARAG